MLKLIDDLTDYRETEQLISEIDGYNLVKTIDIENPLDEFKIPRQLHAIPKSLISHIVSPGMKCERCGKLILTKESLCHECEFLIVENTSSDVNAINVINSIYLGDNLDHQHILTLEDDAPFAQYIASIVNQKIYTTPRFKSTSGLAKNNLNFITVMERHIDVSEVNWRVLNFD